MRYHPAKKINRKTQKSRLYTLIILAGLLLVLSVVLYRQLSGSVFSGRTWRVNLVLNTQPVVLVSIPADDSDNIRLLTIPDTAYVSVPYKYGFYRLSAVWGLGKLEKNQTLFKSSIEDSLAIKIQGWLSSPEIINLGNVEESDLLPLLKEKLSLPVLFSMDISTNLSLWDRFKVWKLINFTSGNKQLVSLLHDSDKYFIDDKLPDQSIIKKINETEIDNFVAQRFEDDQVRQDDLSIIINNSTSVANIGSRFGRIISNFGGKVISIGNSVTDVDNCNVKASETIFTKKIIKYLVKEYGCQLININEPEGVDVVVELGKEFSDRWQ